MIRRILDRLRHPTRPPGAPAHPTDEEILCAVDGELPAREAARVLRHLDTCWTCRHRRTRLQGTIDTFMESYTASLSHDDGLFDVSRLPRAAVAALHATPPHGASVFARAAAAVPRLLPSSSVAVRLGAACATAWLIVFLSSGGPVSARQLVRQVDRAERAALQLSPSPVVYQRLQVARRGGRTGVSSSGTWDVWTDVARRRHRAAIVTTAGGPTASGPTSRGTAVGGPAAGGSAVGAAAASTPTVRTVRGGKGAAAADASHAPGAANAADAVEARAATADDLPDALFTVLQAHGGGDAWPVSLRSHQQWRAQAGAAQDAVIPARTGAGEPALLLDTTTGAGVDTAAGARGIVRATLLVRERDWHPIEQRLVVREDGATSEFVIREAGFDIVPRASLPVAFFDDDRPDHRHALETPREAEPVRPVMPAAAELVTAEVQAMYALHRVGITAADEIAVHRRQRNVEVIGLTTTDERRRTLIAALAPIPLVRARIRTADEVLEEIAREPSANDASALRFDGAEIAADRLPVVPSSVAATTVAPTAAPAVAPAVAQGTATTTAPSAASDALAAPGSQPSSAAGVATTPGTAAGAAPDATTGTAIGAASAAANGVAAGAATGAAATGAAATGAADAPRQPGSDATASTSGRADQATMRRAREAVQQSLTLLERAWALRRLAEWSRRTSPRDVTAGTRALIDVMLRERAEAASSALAALDTTVSAALPAPAATAASTTAPASTSAATRVPDVAPGAGASISAAAPAMPQAAAGAAADERPWTDIATDFFGAAAEIDRDTRRLFTASPADGAASRPEEDAQRLRHGLDTAARFLDALHRTRP